VLLRVKPIRKPGSGVFGSRRRVSLRSELENALGVLAVERFLSLSMIGTASIAATPSAPASVLR